MPILPQQSDAPLPPPQDAGLIAVAMSGGVDSAAAALLLQNAGYRVAGLTMQLYPASTLARTSKACCAGADIRDARRAAQILNIPHYVLDYQTVFRQKVIADFARSYLAGRTPSPCARCNERVKFGDLLAFARSIGANFLATGHYAQRVSAASGLELHRAADHKRDQSYFLFTAKPAQLKRLCFPLGGLTKDEVRACAASAGLALAEKPDSQDLCFVAGKYWQSVERIAPAHHKTGAIVDEQGRVLGQHQGVHRYTLGQRRGLGIASAEPLYVVKIDAAKNEITAGPRAALRARAFALSDVNWLAARPLSPQGERIRVKIRSTGEAASARLFAGEEGRAYVLADAAQSAPAPGQACAFYGTGDKLNQVLGGGWIEHKIDRRPASHNPKEGTVYG